MANKLFVDCHCHLFNIVDIPLYATLAGKVEMGTLKRLAGSFLLSGALLTGIGGNILKKKEEFIRFFERSIEDNLVWLARQVRETATDKTIIMTPLVMDFDKIHDKSSDILTEGNVEVQLQRLRSAIEATKGSCSNVFFCPFIGLDLRKLATDSGFDKIKRLWTKYGTSKQDRLNRPLKSGAVFGIKLYPPIGFNPNPTDDALQGKYLEFYNWCVEQEIPITTHCQGASGSFSVGSKSREVNRNTHGKNWYHLFKKSPSIKNLRINFAHFGGEDGTEDLVDWYGVDTDSWTYYLIKLLKKYPNTYADISAYDFSDEGACENLVKILEWDKNNKFHEEGDYKLADKLLWGSDVPMVISNTAYRKGGDKHGKAEYRHLFKKFKDTVSIADKMTSANPIAFLTLEEDS